MSETNMIQKYTFIVLFLFSSFFFNMGKAQEEYSSQLKNTLILPSQKTIIQTDTIYLAMFFKNWDTKSLQEESSMVIIGKFFNGIYIPMKETSLHDITISDIEESETYRILSDNRKFYVYKYGGNLTSVDILGVSYYDDGCNLLFKGTPKKNPVFNQSLYSQIQSYSQYEGEQDQFISHFLALNKNLAESNVLNRLPYIPTEQHLKIIESSIIPELSLVVYESENEPVNLNFSEDTNNIQFYYCVITASEKPYLITTIKYDANWPISSIIVFEQNGKELNPVLELYDTSVNEFSDHYDLFDVLDIDGDGINEIIIERSGYENTDIDIYKLINGKFELIMTLPLWGC